MSLLLSQVGAPPPPPTVVYAGRIQTAGDPDSGQIEVRGVIRLGLAVTAAVAAVTFAAQIRTVGPQDAPQPSGRIQAGLTVTTGATPAPAVALSVRTVAAPEPDVPYGRIIPAVVALRPVVPQIVRSSTLLEDERPWGVIRPGIFVPAASAAWAPVVRTVVPFDAALLPASKGITVGFASAFTPPPDEFGWGYVIVNVPVIDLIVSPE